MANELTKREENMITIASGAELGDLIKPVIREIHLFDSFISGTTQLEDSSVLEKISEGDVLSLRREVNKFDDNAILLLNADGIKLGYVPEKDTLIFARLMDAGKLLKARITKITRKGSFMQIAVGIYLVDI
ncbi:MAG: HIRAN domain-containing protein [Eubacteriales bacterium]|nr:HIRAN domain-containing protein [Eubacteriales bacterium]